MTDDPEPIPSAPKPIRLAHEFFPLASDVKLAKVKSDSDESIETTNTQNGNTGKKKKTKQRERKESETSGEQEPKAKKPRVKPEKAREVYQKILKELANNYNLGEIEMEMGTLAAAVGYKHPRSDAILAAMKLLKEEGLAQVSKNICKLTDKGIKDHVPEETTPTNPEEALEHFFHQLEKKILSTPKCPKTTVDKARAIWDLLKDGKAHSIDDVLKASNYGMERSTGFPETVKAMKNLGLAEKANKKLEFTEKVKAFLPMTP